MELCYCTVSQCNEQWIVGMMQREFSSSHMLHLLIGLAFIIVPWNILLCYTSWQCMKTEPNSSLLSRISVISIHNCLIILIFIKIFILACILLLSWIPAIVTCVDRGVERHIAESVFLPQIFSIISPLSLFFIPLGFLPLVHIPSLAFCIIVTISEKRFRMHAIKTFMIYYDAVSAIVYFLSAYFIGRAINSFKKSYHLECTIKTKHWMVAVIFAYLISASCMITVLLLIIARSTKSNNSTKDDHDCLVNEVVPKSPEQVSNVSLSTAHSAAIRSNYGTIELSPKPFVVNSNNDEILNLKNTYSNQWVAIRILTNNNKLNIHPTKFLLPPGRISAAEVTMTNNMINQELSTRLLIQWYTLGAHCPAQNVNTLWTRPYCVPRDQWHNRIIHIYFSFS